MKEDATNGCLAVEMILKASRSHILREGLGEAGERDCHQWAWVGEFPNTQTNKKSKTEKQNMAKDVEV